VHHVNGTKRKMTTARKGIVPRIVPIINEAAAAAAGVTRIVVQVAAVVVPGEED
jgi:hypothetical protein